MGLRQSLRRDGSRGRETSAWRGGKTLSSEEKARSDEAGEALRERT